MMVGRTRACAAAALSALLAAACAAPQPRAQVNLSGFPPAFQQGYAEGCRSAGARSVQRDENRYKTDADYLQGWNDGYSICRRR
jgi:hypothetical protein